MRVEWLLVASVVGVLATVWLGGSVLLRRSVWASRRCPRCGGTDWHRRHRRLADHLFGWGLKVRRYRCANPQCNWEGLRQRSHE